MNRNKIIIADDAEINREIIRTIFEEQYDIIEAEDGEVVINCLKKQADEVCLLFLDLIMPKKSGLDVLAFMSENELMQQIPVIMITGEATNDSDEKAYEYGVSDIIYKPFAQNIVMRRAKNIIELFEQRLEMEKVLEERTKELLLSKEKLEKTNERLVNALSSVVEFRDLESGQHIQRVQYFTDLLLKNLMILYPKYHMTKEKAQLIVKASALHDLGKMAIPDPILLKPGKLTKAEFEIVKKHPLYGCNFLEKIYEEKNEFYQYCYDICRYHHERYDGKGYPDGIVGDEIPIAAQIVSIVDVFDALVSKRVYKQPIAFLEAARMIKEGECGVFSPEILACFEMAEPELLVAAVEREPFI